MHNSAKKEKVLCYTIFLDILILFNAKLVKNMNITKINYQ